MTTRRIIELFVVPALLLAGFVLPVLAWGDRLPDVIAVHWDLAGAPDRGDHIRTALSIMLTVFVTAWAAVVIVLLARKVGGTEARVIVASLYWLGGVLLAVWVLGLRANLDVVEWTQSDDLPMGLVFASLAAALPLAGLGYWLASGHPPVGSSRGQSVEPMPTDLGTATVWSGSAANGTLVIVLVTPLLAIGALTWRVEGAVAVLGLVTAVSLVLSILMSRVAVTVGPHGMRVALGWFGWPRRTIALAEIDEVRVEDVSPGHYGGWGLRLAHNAQAHVVRKGPAIRVERPGRSAVVVTVDDAATGAAVLAGHLTSLRTDA